MNIQRREFLLFVTLVAAAAPTAGGAQSGASIPDVSGVWLHPSIPGFEPLSSGPTSVVNKSRLRSGPQAGTGNVNQLVGDYTNPILKPEAAEIVKKHGEISYPASATRTRVTNARPRGCLTFLRAVAYRCCSSQTRSRSFMTTIIKSVAYA